MSTTQTRQHLAIRALCEGAIFVAIAQVLGYLKLYSMPYGGSVTFGMLPLFLYCCRWGFSRGMLACFAYSCLQFLLDGGFAIGWQSILGDYVLAYSVIGLAGLFSRRRGGLYLGMIVGSAARFLVTYLVGATIWGEYMPETFFHMTMTTPWIYSAIYNGIYIGLCMVLCLIAGALLAKPLARYLSGDDLRAAG